MPQAKLWKKAAAARLKRQADNQRRREEQKVAASVAPCPSTFVKPSELPDDPNQFRLSVDSVEFNSIIRPFVKTFKPSELSGITFSYAEGLLKILTRQGGCVIKAKGSWPGTVTLAFAGRFLSVAKRLPKEQRFLVRVTDGTLYIAGLPLPCHCELDGTPSSHPS